MRCKETTLPAEFIVVCAVAFAAGMFATIHFCRSMCCEMEMPGGWTMSMMWMRMHGQTWFASTIGFLLMWLAMMVVMMMPSALPMFLKTRREWSSLCYLASGYFTIWLAAGIGVYLLGMAFSTVATRSELFSRAVPLLSGALVFAAGFIQFTRWKTTHLLSCRSPFGCSISSAGDETSFRLGCKQGAECCICCATLMTIQLALGIMNPIVMIIVATAIAAEKLLPQPEIVARFVGVSAIFVSVTTICMVFLRPTT